MFAIRASIEVADATACQLDTSKAATMLSEVMAQKHSRTHYSNKLHPDDVCGLRERCCFKVVFGIYMATRWVRGEVGV